MIGEGARDTLIDPSFPFTISLERVDGGEMG